MPRLILLFLSAFVPTACRDTTPVPTAAAWVRRADTTPEIAGWLYLRAAAETPDSAGRAALYERVTLAPARETIAWVEARALERFGDTAGALRAYTALRAGVTVLRLRAATARSTAESAAVRNDLLRYIGSAPGGEGVRQGYTLFDRLFHPATPGEELVIARAAAGVRAWGRARSGFEASLPSVTGTPRDRFLYATSLAELGLRARAALEYAKVTAPKTLAAAAGYQRGRALLGLGDIPGARTQLRAVANAYPADTSAAAASVLLADLASDANDDREARRLLLLAARRFPHTRFAHPAAFHAALTAFISGDYRKAAPELAVLVPTDIGIAAQYWLGRLRERQGRDAEAASLWRAVLARDSTSYYAVLAADRLHARALRDMHDSVSYPHVVAVDSAFRRIEALRRWGMEPEVRLEHEWLFRSAPASRDRLLATGALFAGTDQSGKGITLGRRALREYGAGVAAYRIVFPLASRDTIVRAARERGVDPVLVAALIRQESNFNPHATSPAGARGLMQLMPEVARDIAERFGIRPWSSDLLYHPDINITLGVAHLATLVHGQPDVVRALAAYNAGESRVARWGHKRGAEDPELFTERIPFEETREYVKNILENREFYRALYSW